MNITIDELPERPKKTRLQQIQEQLDRQMRPLRQIQEMRNLMGLYSTDYHLTELARQLEPNRQIKEILERLAIPNQIHALSDGLSINAQVRHMMEKYSSKSALGSLGLDSDSIRRASGLNGLIQLTEDINSVSNISKQFVQYLRPISAHQELLENFHRQSSGGLSAIDFARQFEKSNSTIRAFEEAKKSLDRLWPTFHNIDFVTFFPNHDDQQEAEQTAESISQAVSEQDLIQDAVERIIVAIQTQQKPTVQLMIWLIFRKIMDWLLAGAIGAAMGHYAPAILGASPQAAKKAIQENARAAVGSSELLAEYRYVSVKTLIVRHNPRARSPEINRLYFGRTVKLLKKEKDFTLILWTDKENGAEIQGWVFSRYLGKFN